MTTTRSHHGDPGHRPGACTRAGERGASLVEYALLLALIAMVCIGAVTLLGGNSSGALNNGATALSNGTAKACAEPGHPNGYATGAGYATPCYDPDTKSGYIP